MESRFARERRSPWTSRCSFCTCDSVSRKLDADKLTFSNSAKAFSVNSWGTGIQLDVNDDGGSYQSVVFDDNGIGYFVNNQRKWQIRP